MHSCPFMNFTGLICCISMKALVRLLRRALLRTGGMEGCYSKRGACHRDIGAKQWRGAKNGPAFLRT